MAKDFPRHLISELEVSLASYKIINIIGPRQVGKTTLVSDLLERGVYTTLDDQSLLDAFEADPEEQLETLREDAGGDPVIIDEAQRSRSLPLTIKKIVDRDKRRGQFILTGSSNIFANLKVTDSLAGRVVPLKLWPLTISEIKRRSPAPILDWAMQTKPNLTQIKKPETLDRDSYVQLILEGGFPEPRSLALRQRQQQYRSYIDAIIDRDVADVMPLRKPEGFRKLIDQMAARTAQELNQSKISKTIGVKWETTRSYLDVMERLSLITRAPAWTTNAAKRDIKQSKYHFVDTGMNCALRQFDESSFEIDNIDAQQFGFMLESFIFNEIMRILPYQRQAYKLYHWRSADHREIDILAERAGQIVGIEIKASRSVSVDDFKHLKWFAANGPGKSRKFTGIVFYLGDRKLSFNDRCYALPVSSLWSHFAL